ncbi:hypothetical protein [Roseibium sp. MMSF_3544]|uniref:hypothetical protein n=1 Tax=unclassified Roseibium TaxID=2629323 RepID=UPI00273FB956|nr:hypothetical protein [Roseibium sp. MMSF_3544]
MISNVNASETHAAGTVVMPDDCRPVSAKPAQSPIIAILQRNVRILMALNAVSVGVTVLLFVGLFFSWSATSELNQIRQQLDGLQQFEKRISSNVSLMNAGIQSRLSKIDQRMSQIQAGVRMMRIERGDTDLPVDQLKTVVDENIDYFHPSTSALMFAPTVTSVGNGGFETTRSGPQVTVSRAQDPAQGSSLFRRIVTPDGKVRYEKRAGLEN